ncbi:MAG TPA: hypothetical protein VHZ76_04070 [Gammaproteobacteria bacterium]|jgi:hypothetical protein|nr:hypothetical protein [Gammaproteobacteria bacterium]
MDDELIIQRIGEMLEGPIAKSITVLIEEVQKKVKNKRFKKDATDLLIEILEVLGGNARVLENFTD